MSLTKEDLLKRRYKVIGDYPQPHAKDDDCRKFIIGDVLIYMKVNDSMTYMRKGRCGHMSVGVPTISDPEKYPIIFHKLEWYEERQPEDMPAFVEFHLSNGAKRKIVKAEWHDDGFGDLYFTYAGDPKPDIGHDPNATSAVPATESEYNNFIQSKQ